MTEQTIPVTDGQQTAPATEEKKAVSAVEFLSADISVPLEVREQIARKVDELKAQHKVKKVFVIVVQGEEDDEKPLYIAYLRRPTFIHFSQYMTFVQKDLVQANKMLAQNVFLAGDRELIDDEELFLYGAMSQLTHLIDARNGELVKR